MPDTAREPTTSGADEPAVPAPRPARKKPLLDKETMTVIVSSVVVIGAMVFGLYGLLH
jgi:hypothetical protein